jgi:hypothetical protein
MNITPAAALAAFHHADAALTAARAGLRDAERRLDAARISFDLADADRTAAMYRADDAYRMDEHGRSVRTRHTEPATPTEEQRP